MIIWDCCIAWCIMVQSRPPPFMVGSVLNPRGRFHFLNIQAHPQLWALLCLHSLPTGKRAAVGPGSGQGHSCNSCPACSSGTYCYSIKNWNQILLFSDLGKLVICWYNWQSVVQVTQQFLRPGHKRQGNCALLAGTLTFGALTHHVTVNTLGPPYCEEAQAIGRGHMKGLLPTAPAEALADSQYRPPAMNKDASGWLQPPAVDSPQVFESCSWEPTHQRTEKSHSHSVLLELLTPRTC